MSGLFSGSRAQRAFSCLASTVLPLIEVSGEEAQAGTWKHVFFSNLRKGLPVALESVPEEYREACEAIDVSSFAALDAFESEVPLVYDVQRHSTRRLPPGMAHRDYGELGLFEVPMTLDVSGVGNAEVMIADLKTGHGYVPPAHRNWQLAIGALALSALHGIEHARVAIIKAPEGLRPSWDVAVIDGMGLLDARAELLRLAGRVVEARTKPAESAPMVIGEHCRHCPSKLYCPAHVALVHQAAAAPGEMVPLVAKLEQPQARTAYARLKVLRGVVKDLEEALSGYAEEHPIALGDGRVYGPKPGTDSAIDPGVAREVLKRLHGDEVADKACDFEATKASVKRALRPVWEKRKAAGQKVTLSDLESEAFGAISAAGGFKVREVVRVKEFEV